MENVSKIKEFNIFNIPKINDLKVKTDLIGLIDASRFLINFSIKLSFFKILNIFSIFHKLIRIYAKHLERRC